MAKKKKGKKGSSNKKESFSFTEKQYQYMVIALSVGLSLAVGFMLTGGITGMAAMDPQLAGQRAVKAINSLPQVIAEGQNATLADVSDFNNDLYIVTTSWLGSPISIFISKDGQFLYLSQPENIDIDQLINAYSDNYNYIYSQMEVGTPQTYQLSEACQLEGDYDAIFIYSDACGYCTQMKPYVEASEYNWYWANTADEWFSQCAQQTGYSRGVPHFYCIRTGEPKGGAFSSEEAFNAWIANCAQG